MLINTKEDWFLDFYFLFCQRVCFKAVGAKRPASASLTFSQYRERRVPNID